MGYDWMRFLQSDSLLLAPKLVYFTVSTVYYVFYLFRPAFFHYYLRLDDTQYGDISALAALVNFGAMTFWGAIADRLGRHRLILALLCVSITLIFETFILVGEIESQTKRYYWSVVAFTGYSICAGGLLPLTDYLTLKLLADREGVTRDVYSRQCMFGTIAYGVISMAIGWLLEKAGVPVLFYILPVVSIGCIITLYAVGPPDQPQSMACEKNIKNLMESRKNLTEGRRDSTENTENVTENRRNDIESPPNQRHPILRLLTDANFLFMLIVVFMIGSARAVMTNFLAKFWNEQLHLSDTQVGRSAISGVIVEMVIFAAGPWCLCTFGVFWMLLLAQLAMVGRAWAYVMLPNDAGVHWIYLIEMLKGFGFGFTQTSGTKVAGEAAPPGLEATALALYGAVYGQLPAVITALAGGRIYAKGPDLLMLGTAIIASIGLVLCTLKCFIDGSLQRWKLRSGSNQLTVIDQDENNELTNSRDQPITIH